MSIEDRRLTIREASDMCGRSPDTLRRRILDGTIQGAVQDGNGPNARWLIPTSSLIASGLVRGIRAEWRPDGVGERVPLVDPDDSERLVTALTAQIAEQQRLIDSLLGQLAVVTRLALGAAAEHQR